MGPLMTAPERRLTQESPTMRHRHSAHAKPRQRGFTLIEIMVVVVILSVLAVIVVPTVMDAPDKARITKVRQDLRTLESALKLYKLDNFRYPTTEQGLDALVKRPRLAPQPKHWNNGGYLERLPGDPWGNDYRYLHPGRHGAIDVYSLGADGAPGGEGLDADLGNWRLQ